MHPSPLIFTSYYMAFCPPISGRPASLVPTGEFAISMVCLRNFALVSALLTCTAGLWAQASSASQPAQMQRQPKAEQKKAEPEQNEPALPPAPSQTLRGEIKQGIEAQPP